MSAIMMALNYTGDNKALKTAYDEYLEFTFTTFTDWYLTIEKFAEAHGLTIDEAKKAINAGREIRERG